MDDTPRHGSRQVSPVLALMGLLPFVLPFACTVLLILTVGERWPRQIAPGERLWPVGFVVALFVGCLLYWYMAARWPAPNERGPAAAMLVATSVMAWPIWTVGVLPSLNGARLGAVEHTPMTVAKLETTRQSKSRALNYWARLEPLAAGSPPQGGRYFIDEARHTQWAAAPQPHRVTVHHAAGMLGARVVVTIR